MTPRALAQAVRRNWFAVFAIMCSPKAILRDDTRRFFVADLNRRFDSDPRSLDRGRVRVVRKAFLGPFLIFCYLAAQVIRVSTIFGTRNSMTEPPRFLPMASMSPPLNFIAAIPIKKGVAAIIAMRLAVRRRTA